MQITNEIATRNLFLVIDQEERGCISGHVQTEDWVEIFSFSNEGENGWPDPDGLWLVEMGYIKHARDCEGMLEYLVSMGIANSGDTLKIE